MNRKAILALALAALGAACSTANAQQPLSPGPAPAFTPVVPQQAAPANPAPYAGALPDAGAGFAQQLPALQNPGIPVAPSAFGMQPVVTQGIPIPPGPTPQYFTPQQTVALTNTYTTGSPLVTQQTQVYTPTYYYYYYTPPYYVSYQPVAPVAPMMAVGAYDLSGGGGMVGQFGPMTNARGEMGHVRYPYHSYRRPWYFPGQPSFNVNIDGPVW